jgi:hypothetical protein
VLSLASPFTAVTFAPMVSLSQPMLEMGITEGDMPLTNRSKLDLIAILHRQGFDSDKNPPQLWTADMGPNVYRYSAIASGSKLYFVSLVLRDKIVAKNATSILHNASASYYKCLLSLPDLTEMQALVDISSVDESACTTLLDAGGIVHVETSEMLAIEDAPGDHSAHNSDAFSPVLLANAAAELALVQPVTLGIILSGPPLAPVVFFDRHSHSSGILRGYTRCIWGHDKCFKYQQVNVAGSRERLVAFLSAWQIFGEGRPRELHTGHDPPAELVDQQLAHLYG